MSLNEPGSRKLIHVGKYTQGLGEKTYLFLRRRGPMDYVWYQENVGQEADTGVQAPTAEGALRLAQKKWKHRNFTTIICGFRYTLPERDEHGMNALFHQMAASYNTPTGVYFDEELGHNCQVQNASNEALDLWRMLRKNNRL